MLLKQGEHMPREVYNQIVKTLQKFGHLQVNLSSNSCLENIAVEIVEDLLKNYMFVERETMKEIN